MKVWTDLWRSGFQVEKVGMEALKDCIVERAKCRREKIPDEAPCALRAPGGLESLEAQEDGGRWKNMIVLICVEVEMPEDIDAICLEVAIRI